MKVPPLLQTNSTFCQFQTSEDALIFLPFYLVTDIKLLKRAKAKLSIYIGIYICVAFDPENGTPMGGKRLLESYTCGLSTQSYLLTQHKSF